MHTITSGKLLSGISEKELGDEMIKKDVKIITPKKGEVVHIDNFGLIKIWAKINDFDFKEGDKVKIEIINSKKTLKGIFSNRMMNHEDNSLVVYPGSSLLDKSEFKDIEEYRKSGLMEIGLVRNPNSAKELGINIGDIIHIKKIK